MARPSDSAPATGEAAAAAGAPSRPAPLSIGEHVRRTIALAPPVMLARLGLVVMITVDTAMVGRAGGAELAAYAISMPPQIIMVTIDVM
jgi:MATE family multidrug resistance protein